MTRKFVINASWDDVASVWYVKESNVPGLATEADSIPELLEKIKVMVPELMELNGGEVLGREVPLELLTSQQTSVCV